MEPDDPDAGDLVIGTSHARVLLRIKRDGRIEYGPDYTPDEAAEIFWKALAKKRTEAVEREALMGHIEHVMLQLGEQDLRYEQCQIKAKSDVGTPHDSFQEERARGQLEVYMHQLIELARGLALRGRPQPPPPPEESPPPGTVLN